MVTIAELLEWQPKVIDGLAEHLLDKRKTLLRLQDEIHDARPPESWKALASASAWKYYDQKRIHLNDLAAQVSDLAVTAKETGTEVKGAQEDLHAVLNLAAGEGYSVDRQTGEITPPTVKLPPDPSITDPSMQQSDLERRRIAVEREQTARAEEFDERIDQALKRAEWADVGLAKSMADVTSGETSGGSGSIGAAVSSQLPPSLDDLSPEEVVELLGNEIAVETVMSYLEGNIPVYQSVTADFAGSATYKVMQNGQVRMSLHVDTGIGLRGKGEAVEGGVGVGGFTDFEITFDSKEEADKFLAGLDDAAKDVTTVAGRPMPIGLGAYIGEQNVTSSKVGLYGEGEFGFKTPYASGGVEGRTEGWYDEKNNEYGVKVEASVRGAGGHPDAGVKAGGAADFAGEVKVRDNGAPREVTLSGALTGAIANDKLGLNVPGLGSGGGADVELKMDDSNAMWGEMRQALDSGDMSRAAEIAMDHGQVVARATSVTTSDQEFGVAEAGTGSISSKQAWVRPANTQDFVAIAPGTKP
ncbi:MAG: hypothetical protein ACRDS9_15245 [Pseudonocardiaceae bacterium]